MKFQISFYSFGGVKEANTILTEEKLWSSFLAGDKNAFQTIYEKSVSDLFAYGCRISSDQELVKDCIQDLFIYLYRTRSKISQTNKILPYLMLSLKRSMIRKLKEQRIDSRADLENLPFSFILVEDENIAKDEEDDVLQKAMDLLAPREREAIYLRFVLGLDYDELAKTLHLNYQTARNLIHRALQKLRTSLQGKSVFLLFLLQQYKKR